MMDFSAHSNLAMMTAWLLYLAAMALFGVEWALARRLPDDVEETAAESPALVGAGASAEAGGPGEPTTGSRRTVRTSVAAEPEPGPERTDKWGRMGLALAMVGWLANVVGTVLRGVAAERFP